VNGTVSGIYIVDAATVITTHPPNDQASLFELLGRQETQHLVENVSSQYPKVVEELIPNLMSLGNVQKVLQNLLKERFPFLTFAPYGNPGRLCASVKTWGV
jgi:flagellar biosynthesis protein FlhA